MELNVYLTNTTKKHNSTAVPTFSGSAIPCMLKEGSSIIDPVLIFERANVGHTYNYVSIPDFGRYYFVNDIVYDGARIYYHCSVDVLASFKSTIGSSSAYVLRAAGASNGNIIDQYYPVTTRIDQQIDYLGDPWLRYNYSQDYGFWVLGVVTDDGVIYYGFNTTQLTAFMTYLWSYDFIKDILRVNDVDISLNPSLKAAVDPISYLTSCVWLPFSAVNPDTHAAWFTTVNPKVGHVQTTLSAYGVTIGSSGDGMARVIHKTYTPVSHPQAAARGAFLNTPGFTDCRLIFPPFGSFEYNALEFTQFGDIRIDVHVDCTNGIGKLFVYGYSQAGAQGALRGLLTEAQAQVGIPMPITQIITPGLSVMDMAMKIGMTAASIASGNVMGAIAGGASALDSYYSAKVPRVSSVGSRGSLAATQGDYYIEYVWKYVADDDNTDHGRPLCEVRTLSTLAGYQMILEPHIHTSGTASEDDQINAFLAGGYFYE